LTALPQLELRPVAGERDSFDAWVGGACRGFMFLISPQQGWLAQLYGRDEPALITPSRAEAEHWLACQLVVQDLLQSAELVLQR
jgi:hypothetical protein